MAVKNESVLIGLWSVLAIIVLINLCLVAIIVYNCCKVSVRKVAAFTTEDAV